MHAALIIDSGGGWIETFRNLCRRILEEGGVDALLVPQHLPRSPMVQYTLVRDAERLEGVNPVAPVLPLNGGTLAARLTREDPGARVAALLRPCEIRAFLELVKLHQGERQRILLLGIDCLGTFEPPEFQDWVKENSSWDGEAFLRSMRDSGRPPEGAPALRSSCQVCEHPTPEGAADVEVWLLGTDPDRLLLHSTTEEGDRLLKGLGLDPGEPPKGRQKAVTSLEEQRREARDQLFRDVSSRLLPLEKILETLSSCIHCQNCRDVCPICYCKSCVFQGPSLDHPSAQYLRWAGRKGAIKMPTETLFFHLTRMAHMSTSCVGCGQCSSACPMGIPVADIFRFVGHRTQSLFQYVPGRDLEEPLPLATFREDELSPP